ncbi:MAG: GGDEF domain-containing protein [Acidobacteriota bacterium]
MNRESYNIVLVKSESASSDLSHRMQAADAGLPDLSIYCSSSPETTRALLDLGGIDAAICQIAPGSPRDMEALKMVQEVAPDIAIVAVAASRDHSLAPWILENGAQDCLFEDEISSLLLLRSLKYAVERKRSEATLKRLAQYDPVTGLLNQEAFERLLSRWFYRAGRSGRDAFALLVLESRELAEALEYSRRFSEEVLRVAARRVQRAARPGDALAVLDGQRFALLLPAIVRLAPGREAAHRIAEQLAQPMTVQQQPIKLDLRWNVLPFSSGFRDARAMLQATIDGLNGSDARLERPASALGAEPAA